jgi:gliding motility-associated-like protein
MNNNLTLTVGAAPTICQGTSAELSASSNAATYTWTPADGLNNPAIADPVAEPTTTTTYYLSAVLGVCTQTGSVTVTVLPAPTASAGASDTICSGKSTVLQGSGGVTYQWSPATYLSDPTTADPIVDQPARSITYSLTVFGTDGCASVQPATELVYVTPPPVVFAGDDTAVLAGQPVPLDAIDVNNSGFTQYAWSPASGLNTAVVQDPIAQITGNITYTVVATTADGCSGTGSITIDVAAYSDIIVPNAFTPNNDGHNDILKVDAIGIRDFKYFSVYNRWGQEIFTTSNQGIGWDGTRGGRAQDAGVYVWAAMGLDFSGKQVLRKGTVILIR